MDPQISMKDCLIQFRLTHQLYSTPVKSYRLRVVTLDQCKNRRSNFMHSLHYIGSLSCFFLDKYIDFPVIMDLRNTLKFWFKYNFS
ncbi:hypothetical protein XENTR_v10002997 [Xenopus tropicalis]|nr:hypothetical protein XENTR_v10002997 [Xenopus tropicalis]